MISATEALEFIPRGRQVVKEHPGPQVTTKRHTTYPVDFINRLQNVSISVEHDFTEFWTVREIYHETDQKIGGSTSLNLHADCYDFLSKAVINSEEEIYVCGHTAVWSRGSPVSGGLPPRVCLTCDSPIKHGFFITNSFMQDNGSRQSNSDDKTSEPGICLIDATSLRAYSASGRDYYVSLEFPVSKVWITRYGLLLEKDPTVASLSETQSILMPRLFSLPHPLNEMCPVLLKNSAGITSYLTETDVSIVFTTPEGDLVLMYDTHTGKHFVCKLRKCSSQEISSIYACNDSQTSSLNISAIPSVSGNISGKRNLSINMKNTNVSQISPKANQSIVNFSIQAPASPIHRLQSSIYDLSSTAQSTQRLRGIYQPEPPKPIVPEYCLEHIWMESISNRDYCEMASHGFLHEDIVGQQFMCYILSRSSKMFMVRLEKSNDVDKVIFGMTNAIKAKDAASLPKLKMMVILAPCGTIILYSGPTLIAKVHVNGVLSNVSMIPPIMQAQSSSGNSGNNFLRRSSLLPNKQANDTIGEDELHMLSPVLPVSTKYVTRTSGLRDAAGNRVTVAYPGTSQIRISIPFITECPFVARCLSCIRQILNKDLTINLIAKWYGVRNVVGNQNFGPLQEWYSFRNVLLELMGRPYNTIDLIQSTTDRDSDEPKKKRRNEQNEGTDNDWIFLLACASAPISYAASSGEPNIIRNDKNAPLFCYIPLIMFAFHLVYEDLKLDVRMKSYQSPLAEFLYQLAIDLQLEKFSYHYFTDFPGLIHITSNGLISKEALKKTNNLNLYSANVPNIFKWILLLIDGRKELEVPYPFISSVNTLSKVLIELVSIMYDVNTKSCIKNVAHPGMRMSMDFRDKLDYAEDDDKYLNNKNDKLFHKMVKFGISRTIIEQFPFGLHYLFAEYIEQFRLSPPIGLDAEVYDLLLRSELYKHASTNDQDGYNLTYSNIEKEHALTSRVEKCLEITNKDEKVNEDGIEHLDTKLLRLRFNRDLRIREVKRCLTSANPILINLVQLPGVSDHDFIDEKEKQLFALSTRTMSLSVGRGMFSLRTLTPTATDSILIPKLCLQGKDPKGALIEISQMEIPPNMNTWPLFHNGVAAGLCISPDAKDIDSTWIGYNSPKANSVYNNDNAGLLMALGLNGHLKTLTFVSIYDYLIKSDDITSVGLILGLAAANRGTMDSKTTRLLSVHIEALLPLTALELNVAQNTQIAAILGIGLVYQGTAKRHFAEVLVQEIGRPPGPEMNNCIERESYALAAGLALGLVTLGLGETPPGLRDLHLPDTLHYYMVGGNRRPLTGSQKDKYKVPSFQVREGPTVNIDVTAPGATLALGLMFFKTGNEAIAHWMKPPDTYYLLDLVRPDLLLLRIIARGLILWDDIDCTENWLYNQFPSTLKFCVRRGPRDINNDIDHEANCQAYCNIITGASFCIGLRYAGTENPIAFNTLKTVIDLLLASNGKYLGEFAGKCTIESCLVMVLLSISMVYAGTGNIKIFRIIRMMRARIGSSHSQVTYGSQMAIHMALGFLFLGAGRYTISRTPHAIAALICALFPKFPTHSNDNRYHLQAFRHLYVIAVEPRLFIPRDIDTGKLCLCNISCIELKTNELKSLPLAPCMLPELNSLKAVIINDPNYWPLRFERGKNWDQLERILKKSGCVDIKQRAGCLSYLDDPDRLKSLYGQTLTTEQYRCWNVDTTHLQMFTANSKVKTFIHKLLSEYSDNLSTEEIKRNLALKIQFYSCLTQDKLHGILIISSLLKILDNFDSLSSLDIWQIKLISKILTTNVERRDVFLSSELLQSLLNQSTVKIERWIQENFGILKQYLFSQNIEFLRDIPIDIVRKLSMVILFYEFPQNVGQQISTSNNNILKLLHFMRGSGIHSESLKFIFDAFRV